MAQPDFSILRPVDVAGSFLGAYDQEKARQAQAAQQQFVNQQTLANLALSQRQQQMREEIQPFQIGQLKARAQEDTADYAAKKEADVAKRAEFVMRNPTPENLRFQVEAHHAAFGGDRRALDEAIKPLILMTPGESPEQKRQAISQWASQYVKPTQPKFVKVDAIPIGNGMFQEHQFFEDGTVRPVGAPDTYENLQKRKASGSGQTPFFQAVDTPQGVLAFNARTGTLTQPTLPATGAPVMMSKSDVGTQRTLAGSREVGESQAKKFVAAPATIANLEQQAQLVEGITNHPGFQTSVGAGLGQVTKFIPGTSAADFNAQLDQILGGSFLEAYESLRGGGAITEVEGKKATQAKTRMRTATSEKEFVKARNEYLEVVRKGIERAKQNIQTGQQFLGEQQPTQPTERKTIGGKTYEKRNGQWFAL